MRKRNVRRVPAAVRRRRKDKCRHCIAVAVAICVLMATAVLIAAGMPAEPGRVDQDIKTIDERYRFYAKEWSGETVQCFRLYEIPQEYADAGGAFPDVMQQFTYIISRQNGVDYVVILAMIEVESGYRRDAEGQTGDVGYMQIVGKWHEDRMERINAEDLTDPFQNVRVGVDFMAELLRKYNGDYGKALTAYKYGNSGAYKCFFSKGIYKSGYSENVLAVAERIRTEMEETANEY